MENNREISGLETFPGKISDTVMEEIIRRVVEVAHPDRIILFGSMLHGPVGPDSDVDLLVVKAGVPSRNELAQAIYVNLIGVLFPVDVLVATPEDLELHRNVEWSVLCRAVKEGREIYAA